MKQKSLLLFILSVLIVGLTLIGCGNPNSAKVSFSKDEFIVSKQETIDFFDFIKVDKSVTFEFGKNLFTKNDDGTFTAVESGRTTVKAVKGENVLAYAPVVVKQVFPTPKLSSIQVDSEGLITWEQCYVYDEKVVYASEYRITIGDDEYSTTTNSFSLPSKNYDKGVYQVSICAVGTKYIDSSLPSESISVYYQTMEEPDIIEYQPDANFGGQTATITWTPISQAKFNIYLDGILISSEQQENQITLNFNQYNAQERATLKIEAIDIDDNKLANSSTWSVIKLATPNITYSFDGKDGKAVWNQCQGAENYKLQYVDKNDDAKTGQLIEEGTSSSLAGLDSAIYNISIQAIGKKDGNTLYVNSNITSRDFAKLAMPEFTYTIQSATLNLNVEGNDYNRKYYTSINQNQIVATEEGVNTTFDLKALTAGQHTFNIYAQPTAQSGRVEAFTSGSQSSANVVNSDSKDLLVYVLDGKNLEEVVHSLDNDNSKLNFKEVELADKYTFKVNGSDVFVDANPQDGELNVDLGSIKNITPKVVRENSENRYVYEIEITASRQDQHSVNATYVKTLKILPSAIQSDDFESENGYFKWQNLSGYNEIDYYYEIYKVDAEYEIGQELSDAVQTGNTLAGITNDELEYGYYLAKVYTKDVSQDNKYNQYLDSDFPDESVYQVKGYLEQKFKVIKQIASPKITFVKNADNNQLLIDKVEFAGRYNIYVNGQLDGAITPTNSDLLQFPYTLKNKFEVGQFVVTVVAEVYNGEEGSLYPKEDAVLHPASEASSLNVKRLSAPMYSVDGKQLFKSEIDVDSKDVIVKMGENPLEFKKTNFVEIDLSDTEKFNGIFSISVKFIARESEGNNYFLDSQESIFNFKRTSSPKNLQFNNGQLSYECDDAAAVDEYIITLTLDTPFGKINNSTRTPGLTFDISKYIQEQINKSEIFAGNYEQSTSISVNVSAYKLGGYESYFYLPSTAESSITLSQIEAPNIEFNEDTLTLSWNNVGSGVYYSIYVDGQIQAENLVNREYTFPQEYNFSVARSIRVYARSSSSLTSTSSNEIKVRRLNSIDSVIVNQNGTLTINIDAGDLNSVDHAECNSEILVLSGSTITVRLDDYLKGSDADLSFTVFARQSELIGDVTYYYVDSFAREYKLISLADKIIYINNYSQGKIEWNNLVTQFHGNNANTIRYNLAILKGTNQIFRAEDIEETSYPFENIIQYLEEDVKIEISINIAQYTLSSQMSDKGIGYYSSPNNLNKLSTIDKTTHNLEKNTQLLNQAQRYVEAQIGFDWANLWGDATPTFSVLVNSTYIPSISVNGIGDNYQLSLNSNYRLLLNQGLFTAGRNTILITAYTSDNGSSTYATTVYRYNQMVELQVSDDGQLTITPQATDLSAPYNLKKYLIGLNVGNKGTQYWTVDKTKNDLISKFVLGEEILSGNYTIEVIGIDESENILPSVSIKTILGYRLSGVNAKTTDLGNIEITFINENEIDENISFVARVIKGSSTSEIKNFVPERVEQSGVFNYALIHLIELFNIDTAGDYEVEISARKPQSINSKYTSVKFGYATGDSKLSLKKGRYYNENYLKLENIGSTTTKSFRVETKYMVSDESRIIREVYFAEAAKGYWVTQGNIEFFTREVPSSGTYVECYAIDLNEFFKDANAGQYEILVSRLAYDGTKHIQYNGTRLLTAKLNKVTGVNLRDDRVTWNANDDELTEGYYVYISRQSGEEVILGNPEFTANAYFDLLNKLDPGVNYVITIETVSSQPGIISSGAVPNPGIGVSKYLAPVGLEISDGRIQFSLSAVEQSEFISLLKTYQNNKDSLLQGLANASFTDIFTFGIISISNVRMELSFLASGKTERAVVRAIDLLPDLSLIKFNSTNALAVIASALVGGNNNNLNYRRVLNFYNELLSSTHGVACEELLFDDFASNVLSNKYTISVRQLGSNSDHTVSSDLSTATEGYVISVSSSRIYSLQDGGKQNYYFSWTPVSSYKLSGSEVVEIEEETNYVLQLKNYQYYYYFYIEKADGVYRISKYTTNASGSRIEKTLQTPYYLTMQSEQVVVSLSNLVWDFDLMRLNYDLVLYARGNNYAINGKSAIATVNYLSIDINSLQLLNGELTWSNPSRSNYILHLEYEHAKSVTKSDIPFGGSLISKLSLQGDGEYSYIQLNVLGSVDVNTRIISIDSPIYRLENLYKLLKPIVSTEGNVLNIRKDANANAEKSSNQFRVSNNNAQGLSEIVTFENTFEYMAGVQSRSSSAPEYDYRITEKDATEFYVANVGNSGTFNLSSKLEGEYDFLITFAKPEENILLSSDDYTVKAKMLPSINSNRFGIKNGDLTFEDNTTNITEGNIVYEIIVTEDVVSSKRTETFFTTQKKFDTSLISLSVEGATYQFSVRKYVLTKVSSSPLPTDIKTVEGEYYRKTKMSYNDGSFILASETVDFNHGIYPVRRASVVKDATVNNGVVTWTAPTNDQLMKFIVIDQTGQIVDGQVNRVGNAVYFYDEDLIYGTTYKLNVISYFENDSFDFRADYENVIKSTPAIVSKGTGEIDTNVFKLPQIQEGDFKINKSLNSDEYKIDFSEFINNHKIQGDNTFYEINLTLKVQTEEGETTQTAFINRSTSDRIKYDYFMMTSGESSADNAVSLPRNALSIKLQFQVVIGINTQVYMIINGKVSEEFDITPVSFREGEDGDKIEWNDELKQFDWTFQEFTNGKYQDADGEFRILIYFSNNQVEEGVTKEKFFKPNYIGNITRVELYVRRDENSLYCASPLRISFSPNIDYNLFAGGKGTELEPYQIATAEQFKNIVYKNTKGTYFEQTQDFTITINSEYESIAFAGIYNGAGKNIEIVIASLRAETININPIGSANNAFTKVGSLFSEVSADASISRLNIDIKLNVSSSDNSLYAGLAIRNYGKISNVTITSLSMSFTQVMSSEIGIVGLVAINSGTISDVKTNASFTLNSNISSSNSILYGGVALQNNIQGVISRCYNLGNVTIKLRKSNSVGYVGGILLHNEAGLVELCGNEGELSVTATAVSGCTGYVSGVCLISDNSGRLNYSYNNGKISSPSSYMGGIACQLRNSIATGIVSTYLGVKIVGECINMKGSNNYCYSQDAVNGLSTNAITATTLNCGNGYSLVIQQVSGGYKASII